MFSSNSMAVRKWWTWNADYEEEKEQRRCDSQSADITLFPQDKDEFSQEEEEEEEGQREEFTIVEDVDNETLYFTPSPSLLSYTSCPSSLDTDSGEGEHQFSCNDSNDEEEDGVPYCYESSVTPQSQEYMEESTMEHRVTRIENENENLDKENDTEFGTSKGELKVEERKLDIDIFNNVLIFEPPEAEREYQDKEGEDEEEGLPRSSTDLLSFSSSSSSTKDNEKETGMVSEEDRMRNSIQSVVDGQFRSLVGKLIAADNLNAERWKEIICSLSWEAASLIKLDASKEGKAMDPRGYVKVKCIACGHHTESEIIKGAVFKKNVAHKHMPTRYKNPRLLLLGGALEYDGPSSQLSSFDNLLQQENDFFHMILGKIEAHRPNVVLVEKTVSRPAQEFFLAKEISLVSDFNKSRLEYIAQCTGAQIVSSLNNLSVTNVMHCEHFHIEKFVEEHGSTGNVAIKLTKHLMFFEGCPKSLGCTILLKGASGDELKKVKRVVQHAVFAANHLVLETSFLTDERARFLETPSHSAAIVGKPSRQMHSETSICTIHGFAVPVLHKAHAGEFKEHNKDKSLAISPHLSRDYLNKIEQDSEPTISTGPLQIKECVSMPSCRDVCPTNEVMLQKSINAAYRGVLLSPVSSSPLMSGLSASLKWAFGEAFPLTDRSSYAAITSYLGMKDSESNNCTTGDVSTFSDTSGTDDCRKISEESPGKVQSKNEGITDIRNDFDSLDSEPKIESKNKDCTHYEGGISKEGLTTSLSLHQSILVSFSSHCLLKGTVCECSHVSRINYYGSSDKPLERFMKDRLFVQSSRCHACDQPPTAHAYFYTHRQGKLTISVQQLHSDFILPSVGEGKIWMWHRCLRCEWKDGIPQGNRRVVMSDGASVLSYGKFLELIFLNHIEAHIASCGHCLQRDCLQFYGLGNLVACFHYSAINVFGVCLPSKIMFNHSNQQEWLGKKVAEVAEEGSNFFSEILRLIHGIKCNVTGGLRDLSKIEGMLQEERQEFKDSLQKAITKNWQPGQPAADILELNCLRRKLLFESYVWECRFSQLLSSVEVERSLISSVIKPQDLDSSVEKQTGSNEKIGSHMANNHDGSVSGFNLSSMHGDGHGVNSECTGTKETKLGCEKVIADEIVQSLNIPCSLQDVNLVDQLTEVPKTYDKSLDLMVDGKQPIRNFDIAGQEMTSQSTSNKCSARDNISGNQALGLEGRKVDLSLLEGNLQFHRPPSEGNSCGVSDLSDTFNAAWTGAHLFASHALNKILNSEEVSELPFENSVQQSLIQSIVNIESCDSNLNMQDKDVLKPSTSTPSLPVKSFNELKDFKNLIWHPFSCLYVVLSKASQEFLYKLISQYTPVLVNSAFTLLNQGAARLLLPSGINNIVIPVYDDEPTSLIAYALSSKQYWAQISDNTLEEKQRDKHEDIQREIIDSIGTDRVVSRLHKNIDLSSEVSEFDYEGRSNSSENASTSGSHGTADSEPLLHTKVTHAEISFSDVCQLGKVKYSVICYHAKNFSALRKICCLTEIDFICSLSRCKKWVAQGGKSKVFFAKTLDDRFIIKQLTKTELESFLKFAPEYFKHLTNSLSTGSPTCLAKVLGVYQVSIKQSKGSKDGKMDLMVMENLFFGRSVTRIYDLKGSLRNRYNPESSGVLLDQNLIEAMLSSPIFVGNKAKHHLERAVWNDTSFLNSINVMDYSLLVGVDEEQQELVLGIIDFVRQYTWDKHLETWVKASGILGGPKNESPTVISPKEYKKRFRKAISNYFQTVPEP
ncbi:hypothetical protein SUGI_0744430 [Cryptomeria japonica]|uniref:1-phosphatidylinositol-3-phosphate 5-kinase FAB1A n=1 Tax=Cryptomeria japonica TaxID=3369 RepID=UPI002414C611|nr:1-phosphatidylinositol-3-phosphate 5-kinase FAB1A [Cryptomeria japonica]GLJ36860.1 hypothetical protein SUGI_0744430 [Cryptomeria japonica]